MSAYQWEYSNRLTYFYFYKFSGKAAKENSAMSDNKTQEETPLIESSGTELGTVVNNTGLRYVHLYIEETMSMDPGSGTSVVDLIFEIKTCGERKYSSVKDDISKASQTYWGQHFFFEKDFKTHFEVNNENLEIKAYDHRFLGPDSFIGNCLISLERIYSSPKHAMQHVWLPITNIEKDHQKVYGFLKLSIHVSRPGDTRLLLEDESAVDKSKAGSNDMGQIMLPPQIKMKRQQLVIKCIKAEGIVKMDTALIGTGSADPYITLTFGGVKIKTSVRNDTLSPTWNEKLMLPSCFPTINDQIFVKLKDSDKVSSNEVIGSTHIIYKKIKPMAECSPFWMNFYGAYADTNDKKMKNLMNEVSALGSRFKGRVLMQVSLDDTEEPLYGKYKLKEDEYLEAPEPQEYEVWADIQFVTNLVSTPNKYRVSINWGGHTTHTKEKEYDRGVILFFQRLCLKTSFSSYSLNQLPDIIVSIQDCKTNEHISYKRFSAKELFDLTHKSKCVFMNPDKSLKPNLRFDQSGIIKLDIGLGPSGSFLGLPQELSFGPPPKFRRELFKRCVIVANVFSAKNLVAGDDRGLSDPVLNFFHFGTSRSTNIFPRTLNPCWNQRVVIGSWIVNGQLPPLIMTAYDHDSKVVGNATYDFLGANIIQFDASHLSTTPLQVPSPKWLDLKLNENLSQGKILMSVNVFDETVPIPRGMPLSINVKKNKHYLKIKVLGLRNLESMGVIPVCRPFLRINLNSLKGIEQAKAGAGLADIVTEPREPGNNPNIGTILNLELDLPEEMRLMPILSCNVLDSIIGKVVSIGNFEIDLGYFSLISKARLLLKLHKVKKILQSQHNLSLLERVSELIDKYTADIEEQRGAVSIDELEYQPEEEENEEAQEEQATQEVEGEVAQTEVVVNTTFSVAKLDSAKQEDDDIAAEEGDEEDEGPPEDQVEQAENDPAQFLISAMKKGISLPPAPLNDEPIDVMDAPCESGDVLGLFRSEIMKSRDNSSKKVVKEEELLEDEDDLSIDLEFEDKKPLLESTQNIATKLMTAGSDRNILGGITTKVNLDETEGTLLDEDPDDEFDESVQTVRSLPKNVKKHDTKYFMMQPKYHSYQKKNKEFRTEVEIPDSEQFIALGWDSVTRQAKHYRYLLNKELEKSHYMGARGFKTIPVTRGRQVGQSSFFSRLLKGFADTQFKQVGNFKGTVDIISEEDLTLLRNIGLEEQGINMHFPTTQQAWKETSDLDLDIMRKNEVVVRIYIIDAYLYESLDLTSENDPYLRIKLDDTVISDHKNAIDDVNEPKFLKMFEVRTTFPGCSALKIQIMDKDPIKPDDLVGETLIDIENRYYDQRYREISNQPVETRGLFHPRSRQEKGNIRLWVEMYSAKGEDQRLKPKQQEQKKEARANFSKIWDITPRPPTEFELRVIVWEANGVPMADFEDTVDIYVSAGLPGLPGSPEKKTDTHFRSQTGFGSFNWRLLFPVTIDEYTKPDMFRLSLKIWDKDLLKSNEFLSEATLDISSVIYEALDTDQSSHIYGKGADSVLSKSKKFEVKTASNTTRGKLSKTGTLTVSVEVVPKAHAEKFAVGNGRSDPNHNPFLPDPTGRIEWTLNPWKMFTQMVGPKFRRKICIFMCCFIYTLLCLIVIPVYFANKFSLIL